MITKGLMERVQRLRLPLPPAGFLLGVDRANKATTPRNTQEETRATRDKMTLPLLVTVLGFLFLVSSAPVPWEIKGFSYTNDKYCPNVSFASNESDLSLYNLRSTGANYISLIVTQWQDTINTTDIFPVENRTATDDALVHAITTAYKLGMKVMFKPQVDLTSDPAHWRGEIGTYFTEEQWDEWFISYTPMIVHYATLAEQNKVDIFSLGCELIMTSPQDAHWRAVAAKVRQVFSGRLTYSANWGGEETDKTWWDVVDFIGVDAYYQLVPDMGNTSVDALVSGWNAVVNTGTGGMHGGLLNLTKVWNKSLAFTETGACSGGCGRTPVVNQNEMVVYIESIFTAFSDYPWFMGMQWWNWVTDPAFGGDENNCMSPQFKPAEVVFRQGYGGTYQSILPSYPAKCPCIL
eukprot:Phypoly_transcript_10463.p1 GENE.Phypoly_transcript_10463~~Phypoly_transcript_10463.p1  ORF type:complete len:406 (+),score=56.59 Phypoly_transcript_10463:52-1269(+)